MKAHNVTDRILLKTIYEQYYATYCSFTADNKCRESKIYVPIHCGEIAGSLGMDPDIVFGRLYYNLDKKHRYTNEDGSKVHLFALDIGEDRHAVHFPLLSAVLAELEQSYLRFTVPLAVSVIALIASVTALVL